MWLTDGYISSPHTATNLLLLQLCALLLPGEEAPQVPVGVLQQGRHAVRLLPLLSGLGHVFPVQRLDGDGVRERVALKHRTLAENFAISKTI